MPRLTPPALARSLAALVLAVPIALGAQDTLVVGAGARVRLRADSAPDAGWRVGTLVAVRPETLLVRSCRDCAFDRYSRDRVRDFEASIGPPHHAGAGVAVGALAGAAVIALDVHGCHDSGEGPPCGLGYTVLPIAVIAGAIGGGVVGRFVPAGPERWLPARAATAVRPAQLVPAARPPSSWFGEPVPGARGGAQLGAVFGLPVGGIVGATVHCRRTDGPPCQVNGLLAGAAIGAFTGSVIGATTGAAAVSHCPAARSFPRALGGAALWSVPALVYAALERRDDPPPPAVTFAFAVSLPLLQAEGASRAASGACARDRR